MASLSSPFRKSVTITKQVFLPPQFFDGNIIHHICSMLLQQYTDKCDPELGVLISLERIRDMQNTLSKNSLYAEFAVCFDAVVSKPVENTPFEFVVEQVQRTGIFGSVDRMLRIFVPVSALEKYEFGEDDQNSEKNVFRRGQIRLGVGSTVRAQIKTIKFLLDKFGCIAELIDE
jgi:DNA-directed RNA polymerase subunit E'/Rpb7